MTDQLADEIALLERRLAEVLASLDEMRQQIAQRLDRGTSSKWDGNIEAWLKRWEFAAKSFGMRHGLANRQSNTIYRLGQNARTGYRVATNGFNTEYDWWDRLMVERWLKLSRGQGRPPEFAEWVRGIAVGMIDPQEFRSIGRTYAAVLKQACIAEQELTP